MTGKKGAAFLDGNGKKKEGVSKPIPYGTMLFVLEVTDKQYYVAWKDGFGYIKRDTAELLPNGKTAGTSPVNVRKDPSPKGKSIGEWKPGTPVAVVSKVSDFYLVEGKGLRGWVNAKFLTLEGADEDGQKINEGE